MEENKIEIINERLCKRCNISNLVTKFGPKRWVCCKCASIQNNERLKQSNYYKEYYKEHREEFIEKYTNYYFEVVKPTKPTDKKRGRPKKVKT